MTSDVVTADRNCVLNRVGDSLWRQTLHLLFVYRNHHHSRSDDQDFVSSISPLCDESVDQESLLFLTVDSKKKAVKHRLPSAPPLSVLSPNKVDASEGICGFGFCRAFGSEIHNCPPTVVPTEHARFKRYTTRKILGIGGGWL